MYYLKAGGILERGQHYIHISYDFFIETAPDKLEIEFHYEPYQGQPDDPVLLESIREAVRSQLNIYDPEIIQSILQQSTPLKNGIALALADPLGFRGEDHKMIADRKIELAETDSTPCFINRSNPSGKYRIILHVYNIVTDQCTYQIKVSNGES